VNDGEHQARPALGVLRFYHGGGGPLLSEEKKSHFLLPACESQVEEVGGWTAGKGIDGHGGLGEAMVSQWEEAYPVHVAFFFGLDHAGG